MKIKYQGAATITMYDGDRSYKLRQGDILEVSEKTAEALLAREEFIAVPEELKQEEASAPAAEKTVQPESTTKKNKNRKGGKRS